MRQGAVRRIPVGLAQGIRLEVDPAAPAHVYLGTAEVELARHVRRLVRPGDRCFDLGGHNGFYAMVLARLSGERVVSFEFADDGVQRIRRNLALNPRLAPLVEVRQVYVADRTGEGAATLDDLAVAEDLGFPDLVKIDVEGAEARVLRGASAVLARRPHVIVETHGRDLERECAATLARFGYAPVVVTQRRRFREHRAPDNRWLVAEGRRCT
jgi:predicted nicotinamide N-methyase